MTNQILIAYSRTGRDFVSYLADYCMMNDVYIWLCDISLDNWPQADFEKYVEKCQSLIVVLSPQDDLYIFRYITSQFALIHHKDLACGSPDDREALNKILYLLELERCWSFSKVGESTWVVSLERDSSICCSAPPDSDIPPIDKQDSEVSQPDLHLLGLIDDIKDLWEKLPTGRIIYNPPSKMRVALTERIEARIAKLVTKELIKGLKGRGEIQIEALKVSTRMIAELKGDKFKIEPLFSDKEMAIKPDYTQWEWDVTPMERGLHKLKLCVDAVIEISDTQDSTIHLTVLEKEISVMVNPRYEIETFAKTHIKWIITTILGSVGIYIAYLVYLKPK